MYAVRTAAVEVFKPGPFCNYQETKTNHIQKDKNILQICIHNCMALVKKFQTGPYSELQQFSASLHTTFLPQLHELPSIYV
jgi:hypothetical protein